MNTAKHMASVIYGLGQSLSDERPHTRNALAIMTHALRIIEREEHFEALVEKKAADAVERAKAREAKARERATAKYLASIKGTRS